MAAAVGDSHSSDAGALLGRPMLVDAVRSTPLGGTCLLMAYAGYGRRTLLREAVGDDAVWLRLPARELDVDAWRRGALTALVGPTVEGDSTSATPDVPGITDVAEAFEGTHHEWLVLDEVDSRLHAVLLDDIGRLISECPAGHRIAVITRTDLGSTMAEARLAGRLLEIDQPSLAFTPEEGRELLRMVAPSLDPVAADRIVTLCHGWPAALCLTARQLERDATGDVVAWLRTRGAELLVGPWFDGLDASVQEMLLDLAFLDDLQPDLVDAVIPGTEAGPWLARLTRDRGPLWPVLHGGRGKPPVYEYERHPLLTELLRRHAVGRPGNRGRHLRAAQWFGDHGDLAGELDNLFAGGRTAEAAQRLFSREEEIFGSGRAESALRWYGALPDDTAARVEHLLRLGWASALSGDVASAHAALGRLDRMFEGASAESPPAVPAHLRLDAEKAVLEAWLAYHQGDILRVVDATNRARAVFGDDLARNSQQVAAMYLARADTVLGRLAEAEAVLRPLRLHAFALAAIGEGRRTCVEANLAWARGDLFDCRAWAGRRNRWLRELRPPLAGEGPCLSHWLAEAEHGRVDAALAGLKTAVHDAAVQSIATEEVLALVSLAQVEHLGRRTRSALEHLQAARSVVQERSPSGGLLGPVSLAEARIRLLSGDGVRAERLLRFAPGDQAALLLHARLHLLRGSPIGAQLLREIVPDTPRRQTEHAVLSAWSQLSTSRRRAEEQLIRAADVATAHGLRTILVDAPPALLELAGATASFHVHDGLHELVAVAEAARQAARSPTAGALTGGAVLGRGDLQLVALLPTRLTYGDIAAQLGVSVNTVKTRLRRLYLKLDVHDRRSAVDRAAALGVLPRNSRIEESAIRD